MFTPILRVRRRCSQPTQPF